MTSRTTTPDAAVLAFLDGWRELQHGDITAGGALVVRYEPSRLSVGSGAAREIVGYARFLPGGQVRHATLRGRRAPRAAPFAAEIAVPPETKQVELWFQCTDEGGDSIWDSRYGENY